MIRFQYRYRWNGKAQRLSLGRYPALTLKDARNLVSERRVMYDSGKDPRTDIEKTTGESVILLASWY